MRNSPRFRVWGAIPKLRQGYLQNSWMMAGVQIRQIWNSARLDQNNRPVDQIGGSARGYFDAHFIVGGLAVVANGAAVTGAPCMIMHSCPNGERAHLR
jgi:hypothetical protein